MILSGKEACPDDPAWVVDLNVNSEPDAEAADTDDLNTFDVGEE